MSNLRNAKLYWYWLNGSTIDETTLATGIPRSSVGYYFRKFKIKAQKGDPIVTPIQLPQPNQSNALKNTIKILNVVDIFQAMQKGDLDYAYKKLMILKLVKELQNDILPTDEVAKTPTEQFLQEYYSGLNRFRELQELSEKEKEKKARNIGKRISFSKAQKRIQQSGKMRADPNPRKLDD